MKKTILYLTLFLFACLTIKHDPINAMELINQIEPFACDICNKTFATKKQLTRHTNTHTGKKTYTCPTCYMKINDLSNFKQHIQIHTKRKTYSCPRCSKDFQYKRTYDKHMQVHSPTEAVIKKTAAIEKFEYLPYTPIESLPFEGFLNENALTPPILQLEWNNQL